MRTHVSRTTVPRLLLAVMCGLCVAGYSQREAAAAAPLRERDICTAHKCRTLTSNAEVRVFQATARHPDREAYTSTFAQWLPTGRVTALGDNSAVFEGVALKGAPVLMGSYVAYVLRVESGRNADSGFSEEVGRLDVRAGRRELKPSDGRSGGAFESGSAGVTQVAVTPAGSVAWMIAGSFANPDGQLPAPGETPPASRAIYVLPSHSTAPLPLAYSTTIEPGSLAVTAGHIFWLEAGVPRTYAAP